MKTYFVKNTSVPVDWNQVPTAALCHTSWVQPIDISASAQLCRSEHALHVRLQAKETNIRAILTDPLAMVCDDSCLEFFFAPVVRDSRYFNFEFNPLGNLYLGFGTGRSDQVRLILQDARSLLNIQTEYTKDGWSVTFEIPTTFVQLFFPEFDHSADFSGNFFKCGEKTVSPHFLTWNPMSCSYPDFHRSQDFGLFCYDKV